MSRQGTRKYTQDSLAQAMNAIDKAAFYLRRIAEVGREMKPELCDAFEATANELDAINAVLLDLAEHI